MAFVNRIPYFGYFFENGRVLVLPVTKIVDGIKATGSEIFSAEFLGRFSGQFKIGTASWGPGQLRLFVLNTVNSEGMRVANDGDEKPIGFTE